MPGMLDIWGFWQKNLADATGLCGDSQILSCLDGSWLSKNFWESPNSRVACLVALKPSFGVE